jgi:hypothetical protein
MQQLRKGIQSRQLLAVPFLAALLLQRTCALGSASRPAAAAVRASPTLAMVAAYASTSPGSLLGLRPTICNENKQYMMDPLHLG